MEAANHLATPRELLRAPFKANRIRAGAQPKLKFDSDKTLAVSPVGRIVIESRFYTNQTNEKWHHALYSEEDLLAILDTLDDVVYTSLEQKRIDGQSNVDLPEQISFNLDQWKAYYEFPRLLIQNKSDPDHNVSTTKLVVSPLPFVLQPSLFHRNNLPPTLYFDTKLSKAARPPLRLPVSLKQPYTWKLSSITPNSIRSCISYLNFNVIKTSDIMNGSNYLGSWCKHMLTDQFQSIDNWTKVNHYPGSFHLGRKDRLWQRLKLASQKFGPQFADFHPRTFVLPKDYIQLCNYWDASDKKLFIMKPPASSRGNGIKVINDLSQIPQSAIDVPINENNTSKKRSTMIVQQYISNPCLLENSKKFDLRVYVLLTSIDPLRIYVYEEGLVRFASKNYSNQDDGIIDQYMHLTNYFINKKNHDYQINNDCDSLNGSKWTLTRFWQYLEENHSEIDTFQLWNSIRDIIVKTIVCCEGPMARMSKTSCKNGYTSFELFGFDIILDSQFKPYILEVNITPSLKCESDLDIHVKYPLIRDMFNLVGYNLPKPASSEHCLEELAIYFDETLHLEKLTKIDEAKHQCELNPLKNLTQNDLRVLMLSEDELSRSGKFERVFPASNSTRYLKYFEKARYYNLLLDAWEQKYNKNRLEGIALLSRLADATTTTATSSV